ncbi:sigma-70 family RNA polymerase sigma factor [Spirosoma sp. KCTC 42546]|uniref:RNA polymerase sigma factor n=1 Tax=Spirosoma sp. KCTC 42546 TaxID=2520506 RepID=UPI00115819FF|nr:sigma-70 family RNA polymerase sigma factor [Spirosoma sp. KCTC 42546]QDK81033.1 sigma-70 family RNA polymerase sigma factor [Spirosoma sp. KCTC 42546]
MATSPSIPSDEVLMAQLWVRFKADDEKAFDQLAEARYRLLFNYATRFTKDRDLIKDCVQDLFLELWNRRKAIVETPYVTIYLIKALRNNLLRKLRRETGWRSTTEEGIEAESMLTDDLTAENEWIAGETLINTEQSLRRAVAQLPKRQQEVVFLKFYEGLSNDDIAQVMEIEKQTVANFLYRAMNQLRTFLPVRIFS